MTSLHRPQPKQTSPAAKYGPIAAVLVVVVIIAVVALTRPKDSSDAASGGGGNGGSGATTAPGANQDLPVIYNDAKAKNGDLSVYGDSCDPNTGQIEYPTIYAPPCVPAWKEGADNGGDTYRGVSKDKIKIVEYKASTNGDLAALLQGLQDTPEQSTSTYKAYAQMFTDLFETYGREVELIPFQSSGAMDDEDVARSDAIKIAEEIGAFAVIGGPGLAQSYLEELAARKVICVGCGQGTPDSTHQKYAPYVWGPLATPEQFLVNLGDLITYRLNGKNAVFGGDDVKDKKRVFGIVHFEQKVPVYKELEEQTAAVGRSRGYEAAATETYTLDLPKLPERAATIIAKMKDVGVTTIVFLGDPIMPMSLTKAATDANYFPEWIVTGTLLTDTNALARRYDQGQWKHAFGISSLAVKTPRELGDSYRLHEWYYGQPPAAQKTSGVLYPNIQIIMSGIHMAGPKLTPETFRDGLFALPEAGGGSVTPHVSFGMRGFFKSEAIPEVRPDFLGVDDVSLIWWDPDAEGRDESGTEGKGMYRFIDNGARYMPNKMPRTDVPMQDPANTLMTLDELPADQRSPDYPRPTGKVPPA